MPKLSIQPEAEREADRILQWLENERPGLGLRFLTRLSRCHADILRNPYRNAIVFDDFRQALVKKFRYVVYYRFVDDEVIVCRVVHTSRNQKAIWRSLSPDVD